MGGFLGWSYWNRDTGILSTSVYSTEPFNCWSLWSKSACMGSFPLWLFYYTLVCFLPWVCWWFFFVLFWVGLALLYSPSPVFFFVCLVCFFIVVVFVFGLVWLVLCVWCFLFVGLWDFFCDGFFFFFSPSCPPVPSQPPFPSFFYMGVLFGCFVLLVSLPPHLHAAGGEGRARVLWTDRQAGIWQWQHRLLLTSWICCRCNWSMVTFIMSL